MNDHRIEKLERDLEELRGLLTSVILSAKFRDDVPFEAVLAQNEISGERRAALNLVLGAVLSRARGQEPQVVRAKPMIELFPVLSLAQANGGIDLAEAIRLVAEVVGSQALAFEVLKAHKGSGFGEDGYEALGL